MVTGTLLIKGFQVDFNSMQFIKYLEESILTKTKKPGTKLTTRNSHKHSINTDLSHVFLKDSGLWTSMRSNGIMRELAHVTGTPRHNGLLKAGAGLSSAK